MGTVRGFSPRLLRIVALLSLASAFTVAAQTPPLRLVSTAWPPFTNDPGKPRFALDLVDAALGRIGVTADTVIVPAADFTTSLLGRRFDGSPAAWKDQERERVLMFSEPYLENRLILVGRRGDDVSATTFSALKGKKIAIVEGYSYGDAIDSAGPTFVRTSTEEESLSQLLTSAVDYTLMDELVVRYITSNYPKESQSRLQFGSTPIVTRSLHLALRKDLPGVQSIIDRFNAQIRAMITDRTYHRLLHLDWINADVDGDGIPELVPRADRIGAVPPKVAYSITTSTDKPATTQPSGTQPRFYVGGSLYTDWASVPNSYKVEDPKRPDPSRSAASIFTFRW
jgi:polar amino acid transport system substrate-binding protein